MVAPIIRGPNQEQKLAIEHHGGMLLSAGAGSGKTYVLIEHMIYLLEDFFAREKNYKLGDFELKREVASFLSSIVMMTFTNKAAQEMQIRLEKRLQEKLLSVEDGNKWLMVIEQLPHLNMGTIHSFCMKLIRQGLIEGVDSRAKIVSQFASHALVGETCHEWLKSKSPEVLSHQVFDTLFIRFNKFIDSFCSIFLDPELRLSWEASDNEKDFENFNFVISQLFHHYGLSKIPDYQKVLLAYKDTTSAKWIATIDEFYSKLAPLKLETIEGIQAVADLFSNLDRLTTPPAAKKDEQLLMLFDYFKALKSFNKDCAEELIYFHTNRDVLVNVWFPVIKELYTTIAQSWNEKDGLTFSDLEYYVHKALKNRSVQNQITKTYKYLIVDEFQDTSEIQFKILQQIIDNDFTRIFCVGDPKQAIYGFRGGELSVFLGCRHKVPQNRSLLANYRSEENIINFNNEFFDYLFRFSSDFEGIDKYAVEVEYQKYPHTRRPDFRGDLTQLTSNIILNEEDDFPVKDDINQLEASILHKFIEDQIKLNPTQEICILYSKLAPSKYLIDRLIKNDISFVAQIKIPYADDPTLGILQVLLHLVKSTALNSKTTKESVLTLLESYIAILEIPATHNLSAVIDRFLKNYALFGPLDSFYIFLSDINLKVADFRSVVSLLEEIVKYASDDCDLISFILNEERATSYSAEFRFPGAAGNIKIMTTHAAKGLEFEHVILAGIHNNAKGRIDSPTIGKWPFSFRWRVGNKTMRTPAMILEAKVSQEKEFAESKRLFYVAGTRARKCLTWSNVTVTDPTKKNSGVKYGKNWIDGLRKIHGLHFGSIKSPFREVKDISVTPLDQKEILNISDRQLKLSRPLFHIDSSNVFFGVVGQNLTDQPFPSVAVSSELSVTRASMLVDCPMKFYLSNIIRFSEEDVDYLNSLVDKTDVPDRDHHLNDISSSAERGSHLHGILSKLILTDWSSNVMEELTNYERDLKSIEWVKELLRPYFKKRDQFYSEQPVKFKFAGHMISGTPDLVIIPEQKNQHPEIWDFKTGAEKKEKEGGYWTQLRMYAHHYFQRGTFNKIMLKLVYLDQQILKVEEHSSESCNQKLEQIWSLKKDYMACNHKHCLHCNYGNICPKNAFSATYP